MALDGQLANIDDPQGHFEFYETSAHEAIEIAAILKTKPRALLITKNNTTYGEHLEPYYFWRVPFRASVIIVKRGMFSGFWDVDFIGAPSAAGISFVKHMTELLGDMIARPNTLIAARLEDCDISGCPLGRINWN